MLFWHCWFLTPIWHRGISFNIIQRIMLFWHRWFLTRIWHWGIFVKWSYLAELFLASEDSVTPKANLGFMPLIAENAEAWSAIVILAFWSSPSTRSLSSPPLCVLVTLLFSSSPSTHSLSSLIFFVAVSALVFSVVVFFFVLWSGC